MGAPPRRVAHTGCLNRSRTLSAAGSRPFASMAGCRSRLRARSSRMPTRDSGRRPPLQRLGALCPSRPSVGRGGEGAGRSRRRVRARLIARRSRGWTSRRCLLQADRVVGGLDRRDAFGPQVLRAHCKMRSSEKTSASWRGNEAWGGLLCAAARMARGSSSTAARPGVAAGGGRRGGRRGWRRSREPDRHVARPAASARAYDGDTAQWALHACPQSAEAGRVL